jgi:peptide/nickel transport system permease protein
MPPPIVAVFIVVLVVVVVSAALAPLVAPHDPTRNDLIARLQPPAWLEGGSTEHLLGTDQLGRDVLTRLIYGARVSLIIAVLGTLFGAVLGVTCGLAAGLVRGRLDELMMFLVDAWLALPFLVIALVLVALLGTSLPVLVLLAALSGWAGFTRISRGLGLQIREEQYVLAARAIGVSQVRLLIRHSLPNVIAPLIVLTTTELTGIILLEASLSYLGFGIQPPLAAWGLMVNEGREYLNTSWWLGVFPGALIMLVAISVSLVGDWLRDVLDPTTRT